MGGYSNLLQLLILNLKRKCFTFFKDDFFSYKHAIDGMARVAREEGFSKLFSGVDWATGRAVGLFFSKGILSRRKVREGH